MMEKVTLNVDGMSCSHCEKAISEELEEMGVEKVKAMAKKGQVMVKFDPAKITIEQIQNRIIEVGYTVQN